jgi:hypothetical protein
VDRGKRGSKHHLIVCGAGSPLAAEATAANVNDVTRFLTLVDGVPPVRGKRGRPRRRPRSVYGDRAYHSRKSRRELLARRIKVRVARPGDPHGSGLGRTRWWSSARSPGFTSTGACAFATSDAPTSTKRS